MVEDEKPFFFLAQAQQLFFLDDEQMINWKLVVHKEPQSSYITMDNFSNSSGIDDGAPWLSTPITHPSMPREASLVGAKELFAKESTFINSTLAHLL